MLKKKSLLLIFLLIGLSTIGSIGFSSWVIVGGSGNINGINVNVSDVVANINTPYFKFLTSTNKPYIKNGFVDVDNEVIVNKGYLSLKFRLDLFHYRESISSLNNKGELSFLNSFYETSDNTINIFDYLDIVTPVECYYNISNTTTGGFYNIKCNNMFDNSITPSVRGYRSEFMISSLNESLTDQYLFFEIKYSLVVSDIQKFETTIFSALKTAKFKLETFVFESVGA